MSESISHPHKQKLLFVVNEVGEFVELRRVALAAKLQGYEIAFLFAQPNYKTLGSDRAFCRFNGFDDYYFENHYTQTSQFKSYKKKAEMLQKGYMPHSFLQDRTSLPLIWRIVALVLGLLMLSPLMFLGCLGRRRTQLNAGDSAIKPWPFPYIKSLIYAKSVLDDNRPDIVIFGQEFPGSPNALLTKICNRRGTPTLIIPFAVGTTREMVESLGDKFNYEARSSLVNRIAASLFPHWVNYYAGKRLLRLPGWQVMLLEALDLAPEHPWLPNNSLVARVAVESPEMMRYYRRMRFPESQLRLTGAGYDDDLAGTRKSSKELKQRLCRQLQLDAKKPLLVCAWPTNQFGSRFIPLEFKNYEQLCHAWASALSLVSKITDFNVVIRLHPVTDPEFVVNILQKYKLVKRITNIDTLKLVPVCDLFVACVSSTLRWAIACGIPAVNYDCYDYGYTDFDPAKGVSTVKKYADFELALQRLTEDAGAYAEARRLQEECSTEWGIHDGQSIKRILKLIGELADHSTTSTGIAESPIERL